jgi:lipoyl(octanoyl) transferase
VDLTIRNLGRRPYVPVFEAMKAFTDHRDAETEDEIWVVEHDPVFTQGLNGKPEHLLSPGDIPVVQVDRGGQVTYHGPGQLVIYVLIDVRRRGMGVRTLVTAMEKAVINLLAYYDVQALARPDAPGVYVDQSKVSALGLRVRKGASYHGLSLNCSMDMQPFQRINPCGYSGMSVTQLTDLGVEEDFAEIARKLCGYLVHELGYTMPDGWCLPEQTAIPELKVEVDE